LSDACVGVLIVSLCAILSASVMEMHRNEKDILQEKMEEIEEQMELDMERTEPCIVCKVDLPS
jgi:hypothetical protein